MEPVRATMEAVWPQTLSHRAVMRDSPYLMAAISPTADEVGRGRARRRAPLRLLDLLVRVVAASMVYVRKRRTAERFREGSVPSCMKCWPCTYSKSL